MITISGLGCAAAAALFFTLLPSCGRDRLVRQVESPVSKQEETLALGGADKLRGLFNKGDCQTIFRYAAFAGGSYSQKRWLDDCARLRENMGIWGGFVPSSAITCGGPERIVCIDGLAQFEKGDHSLELGWSLAGGNARLLFLVVQGSSGPIRFPPLPQKLMDCPPSRDLKDVAQTQIRGTAARTVRCLTASPTSKTC